MSRRTERNRARDVISENGQKQKRRRETERKARDSTKKENNHHAEIIFPELLASLSCAARRRGISPSPSYSSFSSLTRFLPWTWIHFSLQLCLRLPSVFHPPWTSLRRRRLRSHGSRIYAMTNCLPAWLPRDRRRQLEVRRIQGNCSFDG